MGNPEQITKLFGIEYPIIQGGMIWCSGWELCSAVSNAGGLGLLGAGSMKPDTLAHQIDEVKAHTDKPYGVNVPLISPYAGELMEIVLQKGVQIVFTSAGNPRTWTPKLKEEGRKVAHVVSSSRFAQKCEQAGADAIVAEGFEAGGHNGREETTTLTLVQEVRRATKLPLIAAGGIATGRAMLAALALGADAVQVGTLFAACRESSAHQNYKDSIQKAGEGDTMLTLKRLIPVRLIKNDFYFRVQEAEDQGADIESLKELEGRARARAGIFEGDLKEGKLEAGQASSLIDREETAGEAIARLLTEYNSALVDMKTLKQFT